MLKVVNLFYILFVIKSICNSHMDRLHIGRIVEGQFEYPELNGWMTPLEAIHICENDEKCAAFTYKGSRILDIEVEIYFFHVALNIDDDLGASKWIYYKSQKNFVVFRGTFENQEDVDAQRFVTDDISGSKAEDECMNDEECIAVVRTDNFSTAVLLDFQDLQSFRGSDKKTTYIKVQNISYHSKIVDINAWDDIDTCCPGKEDVQMHTVLTNVKDTLPRIPCSIDPNDFLEKYVKRREPVILLNCSDSWTASNNWTWESLLSQEDGSLIWKSYFEVEEDSVVEYEKEELKSGSELLSIVKNNGTIKVFDPIAKHQHLSERKNGKKLKSEKLHLLEEFRKPYPVPKDYYNSAGILTDYQWVLLGSRGTGTEMHTDPEFTSAWNTVLSGHKWWVMMPPEVPFEQVLCDEDCSCEKCSEGNLNVQSWFSHVLPQLRERKWYGTSVKEFIQSPGETIYMPGNLAPAVINIDDTISVTENYFLVDSLEDWVHGIMAGKELLNGYESRPGVEERFWKSMYFKQLNKHERTTLRTMMSQVQEVIDNNENNCGEMEEDDDEEEEFEL